MEQTLPLIVASAPRFLAQIFVVVGLVMLPASAAVRVDDGAASGPRQVLVVVNGEPVSEGDLEFLMISRRIPDAQRDAARQPLLEQLVDRRVMRQFLAGRRAEAGPAELDAQVETIRRLIRRGGDDPDEVLARLGYSDETLRAELALPLAWRAHVRRIVTPARLREFFEERRAQFDGTQVRASQIFLKAATDAESPELLAAEEKLRQIREEIVAGSLTFAEAARRHSQAPTAAAGGDVGFFPYRGRMPEAFARVAFSLEVGEISEPFRSPFGVHLCTATERKPGDLSLEDVREQVFTRLAQELWRETVREQREKGEIEWKSEITSH